MKTILKKGINENKSLSKLKAEIVRFKNNGGSQREAQTILEELRVEFQESEDKILELLDYVTDWCQRKHQIWREKK